MGSAVPRTIAKSTPLGVSPSIDPVYRAWPYYGTALGFGGLGFYTDPFLFGHTYSGFAYLPSYSGYPAFAPYPFEGDGPTGGLRLKVEPKQAWTPVAEFAARGLDAVNFGPGEPEFAHRRDERVAISAMQTSLETLRRFLCS